MKNSLFTYLLFSSALFTLGFPLSTWAANPQEFTPQQLAHSVFLGQFYPSGRVYLQSFIEDDGQGVAPTWPRQLQFHSLVAVAPQAVKTRQISLTRVLKENVEQQGAEAPKLFYIPAIEGMDGDHEGCGDETKGKKNPRYSYLERAEDFFSLILYDCEAYDNVGLYAGKPAGANSYVVIAFDSSIQLSMQHRLRGDIKRPQTSDEQRETLQQRQLSKLEQEKHGCTTEPAFLDDAVVYYTAQVQGGKMHIRVSGYDDPGCNGHLSKIYILDILQGETLLKRYRLAKYRGSI